ncbi:MAG TPA: AzlD domain-containing protein [Salinisphaeraceae bacterium]|nr:AzlD domain-containing protein [Salinisphaeraceae bacterium]
MSTTALWLTLVGAALITFLLRWSFIALSGVLELPAPLRRALQFVPAAVLAAIILPAVLISDNELQLPPENWRLLAAALAGLVAWRTHNIVLTLIVGMAALWGLTALQVYF